MSKTDDETSDMEEGMTTSERRRRRRRGAGLRIPTDNVPRRSAGQSVVAPVPEEPGLAVSIAYSFDDDASGPNRVRVEDLPDIHDDEDETRIAPPPQAPEHSGDLMADGSMPGGVASLDDVVPDGRTRQMPAMNLEALGLTDLEAGDGTVRADVGAMHAEAVRAEAAAAARAAEAADAVEIDVDSDDDADDDGPTLKPVVEEPRSGPVAMSPAAVSRVPTVPPVRVSFRNLAAEAAAALAATGTPRAVPEDVRDESGGAIAVDDDDSDGVPRRRITRAATVALSEEDLEELLELTPPPQTAPLPPGSAAPPPGVAPIAAPPSPPSPPPVAARADVRDATAARAPEVAAARTPAAEPVTLAEEDVHEVVSPADASDSGEILADEIVEVEEQSRAPAVGAAPRPSPATPAAAAPPSPPAAQHKPPSPPAAAPVKKSVAARAAAAAAAAAPSPADAEARKKRRGKPWFEEVFDEDYLRTLPFLTPQATQGEALMVIESLGVAPGASVLDVGCGYGRHAMELAARGFHVVGIDMSLPLLLRGADEAQRRGLDINFVHADMRDMDFDAQFDGAYCLFSTFGYFDDETNKKTATLIAKALKPGAKIMLEVLNRDYVIGDLPTRVWWEGDGCVVLEEVEFNYFSSRIQSKRSVVFDDGRQVEQEISVRVYSLHEIGKLLHAAGFRVLEVSGSMATRGRFLGNRSREIIVVAERRSGDPFASSTTINTVGPGKTLT